MRSTSRAPTRRRISPSGSGSTTASARHWRGSRHGSCSKPCSHGRAHSGGSLGRSRMCQACSCAAPQRSRSSSRRDRTAHPPPPRSCLTWAGKANPRRKGGSAVAIALYDLSVANYLQGLGAVAGFLEKGLAHFTANHVDLNEIVETRLFPDMLPFRFQLQSVAHHSLGAIEGVKNGLFQPPPQAPVYDYHALQKLVVDAQEALQ